MGDSYFSDDGRPLPRNTWDASVRRIPAGASCPLQLEPPAPSGSPFPHHSVRSFTAPRLLFLPSSLPAAGPSKATSALLILDRGSRVRAACEPEQLLPPEQVTYGYGLML